MTLALISSSFLDENCSLPIYEITGLLQRTKAICLYQSLEDRLNEAGDHLYFVCGYQKQNFRSHDRQSKRCVKCFVLVMTRHKRHVQQSFFFKFEPREPRPSASYAASDVRKTHSRLSSIKTVGFLIL